MLDRSRLDHQHLLVGQPIGGPDERRDVRPEAERLATLARAIGCPPHIDTISAALLANTRLPADEHEAVRSTVQSLIGHDLAWRAMQQGVVPPAVRAQSLAVTVRSSATDPADMLVALLFATIRDLLAERPARATAQAPIKRLVLALSSVDLAGRLRRVQPRRIWASAGGVGGTGQDG